MSELTALTNISVWDGVTDDFRTGLTILIEDGIIRQVGAAGAIPDGALVHDLGGKFVIPGLCDLHVHLTSNSDTAQAVPSHIYRALASKPEKLLHGMRNAQRALASGFTTLRVMGHREVGETAYRDFVDSGLMTGPRMVVAPWWISMTAGHGDLFYPPAVQRVPGDTADGPDDCRQLVRLQVRSGADFIKVMASGGMLSHGDKPHWPNYTIAELRAIVEEAHDLDLRVAAHAHSTEGIRRAVSAGADTIEHGSFQTDETIQMMLDHGTTLVPTLAISDWLAVDGIARGISAAQQDVLRAGYIRQKESARRAWQAGVPIAMGTDSSGTVCPFGQHARELELYTEIGMSPLQALRTATTVAAEVLGRQERQGTLEAGKVADLVVLNSDPIADIAVIRRPGGIHRVFKDGMDVTDVAPPSPPTPITDRDRKLTS